ncbi:MAG: DNA-binding transcriptional regulator [Phycisphaeraceae bacterium]
MAIHIEMTMPQSLAMMKGIAEYANLHDGWMLHMHPRSGFAPLPPIEQWTGQGVIAHVGTSTTRQRLQALSCPVVNVSSLLPEMDLPSVVPDNARVGRLAVEHFRDRGFQHLAFCGYNGHAYSAQRGTAFREAAEAAGLTCHVMGKWTPLGRHPVERQWDIEQADFARWLARLPRPVGVLTANDMRGRQLIEACRALDIPVPEEVSVVGVDNDEVLCLTARPRMSSVALPFDRLGYEAAALLDRLMRDEAVSDRRVLIPPTEVVTRQSSENFAVEDLDVARALHFIREHAVEPIGVEDVLADVMISRRSLERRFAGLLGRSPQAEIRRVRLERAKQLLAGTELRMPEVAVRSGFSNAERLSVVFRRETGVTPTDYRRTHRARDSEQA